MKNVLDKHEIPSQNQPTTRGVTPSIAPRILKEYFLISLDVAPSYPFSLSY